MFLLIVNPAPPVRVETQNFASLQHNTTHARWRIHNTFILIFSCFCFIVVLGIWYRVTGNFINTQYTIPNIPIPNKFIYSTIIFTVSLFPFVAVTLNRYIPVASSVRFTLVCIVGRVIPVFTGVPAML